MPDGRVMFSHAIGAICDPVLLRSTEYEKFAPGSAVHGSCKARPSVGSRRIPYVRYVMSVGVGTIQPSPWSTFASPGTASAFAWYQRCPSPAVWRLLATIQ